MKEYVESPTRCVTVDERGLECSLVHFDGSQIDEFVGHLCTDRHLLGNLEIERSRSSDRYGHEIFRAGCKEIGEDGTGVEPTAEGYDM